MEYGEKIKAARIAAGMTQKELAASLGVPFQSISQWERGIRNPKIDTLVKIARALGVEPSALVTLIPPDTVNKPSLVKVQDILKEIDERIDPEAKDPYDATGANCWFNLKKLYILASNSDDVSHTIAMDTISSLLYGGYDFSSNEFKLIKAFSSLNNDGQIKAIERVEELSEITRYKDGGDQ